jgi:hypothetical protein
MPIGNMFDVEDNTLLLNYSNATLSVSQHPVVRLENNTAGGKPTSMT